VNKIQKVHIGRYRTFYVRYKKVNDYIVCQVRGHPGNFLFGLQFHLAGIGSTMSLSMQNTNLQFLPSLRSGEDEVYRVGLLRFEYDSSPRFYSYVDSHENEAGHTANIQFRPGESTVDEKWFSDEIDRISKRHIIADNDIEF